LAKGWRACGKKQEGEEGAPAPPPLHQHDEADDGNVQEDGQAPEDEHVVDDLVPVLGEQVQQQVEVEVHDGDGRPKSIYSTTLA